MQRRKQNKLNEQNLSSSKDCGVAEVDAPLFRRESESVQCDPLCVGEVGRRVGPRRPLVRPERDHELLPYPQSRTVEKKDVDFQDSAFVVAEEPVFLWALVYKTGHQVRPYLAHTTSYLFTGLKKIQVIFKKHLRGFIVRA